MVAGADGREQYARSAQGSSEKQVKSPEKGKSASAEREQDGNIHWLVCERCRFPIAGKEELFEGKANTWSEQVFAYELEVLEKDVWCYSATNPAAARYDVIRFAATSKSAAASFAKYADLQRYIQCLFI